MRELCSAGFLAPLPLLPSRCAPASRRLRARALRATWRCALSEKRTQSDARFSRRAFLLAAVAATLGFTGRAASVKSKPMLDTELSPKHTRPDDEAVLDWMRPPEERFGFNEHAEEDSSRSLEEMEAEGTRFTTATPEDYARVTHVGSPNDVNRMAKIYLARAGVTGFVAGYCAIAMAISERESLRTKLPVVYDPTVLNLYFSIRPDKVLTRMMLFFREIAWLSFELARDRALQMIDTRAVSTGALTEQQVKEREQMREVKWAGHLREAMTRLGPAVIKFGQAAATRQDLFTFPVIKELQKLQDAVLPFFPMARAYELIEQELGATPDHIFDSISPNPVAGASLGMVFKAKVEGVDVAVKVQRPEVAEQIAMDCYIVRYFATVANALLRSRTDFAAAVDEYASRLFEELDYTNELKNMKKFREVYGGVKGIYLPKAFESYSSRRVLVTEWVEGVKLIDDEAKVKAEDIPLVENGIRFALMQLLDKGYMHADMHNGNSKFCILG
eukprot:TRINITY_DN66_c0_g1_i3.p1 TRINITY_DN66_c0_g1~~TRINITY_DN66_c0_g1_i3.p1  ORF type:complete len:503 (-),score=94.51 TRINITY_DN66_c0_g1_i3:4850-6358(-)